MNRYLVESVVGFFVLLGILAIGYMTIKLGKMEVLGGDQYVIYARFSNVSGVRVGSSVEMSGVQVGQVRSVKLNQKDGVAVLGLSLRQDITLPDDSVASVRTSGLIGDKFIRIAPGGSDDLIQPGGFISETESAVDIEDLISKYVFGGVK